MSQVSYKWNCTGLLYPFHEVSVVKLCLEKLPRLSEWFFFCHFYLISICLMVSARYIFANQFYLDVFPYTFNESKSLRDFSKRSQLFCGRGSVDLSSAPQFLQSLFQTTHTLHRFFGFLERYRFLWLFPPYSFLSIVEWNWKFY